MSLTAAKCSKCGHKRRKKDETCPKLRVLTATREYQKRQESIKVEVDKTIPMASVKAASEQAPEEAGAERKKNENL